MQQLVLQFIQDNWQSISALLLWLAVRLIPTGRNLDLAQMLLQWLNKVVPNRKSGDPLNPGATH